MVSQLLMNFKLTNKELAEFRGKQFASTDQPLPSSVTMVVDVKLRQGRCRIVHEFQGVLRQTPLSVFLLRFPFQIE